MVGTEETVVHSKIDKFDEYEHAPVVEQGSGAVLLDIRHAHAQPGGADLKLTKDGHVSSRPLIPVVVLVLIPGTLRTVLVPQPTEDPNDLLNWSDLKKNLLLLTISLAAFQSEFQTAAGVPSVGLQGVEWNLNPVHVNYAGNLNVLMKCVTTSPPLRHPFTHSLTFSCSGIGGLSWVPLICFWGRAPVLFWATFIGTFLPLATCLVPTFAGYYGLRALMGFFFSSSPAVGLAFIQDIFFLHEHARKIGVWIFAVQICPNMSPMFGSFIVSATGKWRDTYWMGFGLESFALIILALFLDESFFRRDLSLSEQPIAATTSCASLAYGRFNLTANTLPLSRPRISASLRSY